jgi:hypothetical protein
VGTRACTPRCFKEGTNVGIRPVIYIIRSSSIKCTIGTIIPAPIPVIVIASVCGCYPLISLIVVIPRILIMGLCIHVRLTMAMQS